MRSLVGLTQNVHAITALLGGTTYQSNPALYREASPIFGVTAQSAPMLIVQGTQDTIVPASQCGNCNGLYASIGGI